MPSLGRRTTKGTDDPVIADQDSGALSDVSMGEGMVVFHLAGGLIATLNHSRWHFF